jgi:hypothetical protein
LSRLLGTTECPEHLHAIHTLSRLVLLATQLVGEPIFGLRRHWIGPQRQWCKRSRHVRCCDGFRTAGAFAELARVAKAGGPASESLQGTNPREAGTRFSGRYGDLGCSAGATRMR